LTVLQEIERLGDRSWLQGVLGTPRISQWRGGLPQPPGSHSLSGSPMKSSVLAS